MRLVPAVTAAAALCAFLACVGDDPSSEPAGDEAPSDAAAEATSPASTEAGDDSPSDAGGEEDATADADAGPPPCVTGQTRSETRSANRLRSIAGLTASFGFVGASGPGWQNPSNGKASDDLYASVSFPLDAGGAPNGESLFLVADAFGFKLPPAAAVSGIEVQVEWRGNAAGGSPIVQGGPYGLMKAGVLYQEFTSVNVPTSEATTRFGDASALWGAPWDAPDINDGAFGTALYVRPVVPQTKTANAFVDHVAITISYVCP